MMPCITTGNLVEYAVVHNMTLDEAMHIMNHHER